MEKKKIIALSIIGVVVAGIGYHLWKSNSESKKLDAVKDAELSKPSTATPGIVADTLPDGAAIHTLPPKSDVVKPTVLIAANDYDESNLQFI